MANRQTDKIFQSVYFFQTGCPILSANRQSMRTFFVPTVSASELHSMNLSNPALNYTYCLHYSENVLLLNFTVNSLFDYCWNLKTGFEFHSFSIIPNLCRV